MRGGLCLFRAEIAFSNLGRWQTALSAAEPPPRPLGRDEAHSAWTWTGAPGLSAGPGAITR